VRSPLVVYLPSQVVIFISYLVQPLPQLLYLDIQTVSHRVQPLFFNFLFTDINFYLLDFLNNSKNTF